MISSDGNVFLTNINEDLQSLIDVGDVTFKWYRIVGEEERHINVSPDRTWVTLQLDPNNEVVYSVQIFIGGIHKEGREYSFQTPQSQPNILLEFAVWSIIGIVAVAVVVSVITVVVAVFDPFNRKNFIARK